MPDYFTLLRDRVTLKCQSIDRIFLQAYVPKLQTVGQVCTFLRWRRGFPVPSSAAFGKIGDAYVEAIYAYAKAHNISVVRFEKGQDKEKTAHPFLELAAREGKDRVVLIGIAQEKSLRLAILEEQGPGESRSSSHGMGPTDGLYQSLLFLPLGLGMGRGVLED
jgi:hypothetical protein